MFASAETALFDVLSMTQPLTALEEAGIRFQSGGGRLRHGQRQQGA